MIADFETRLATVLGARLPAPHTRRVAVAPGPDGLAVSTVLIATREIEALGSEAFGATRRERLPGGTNTREVLRLRCRVGLDVALGDRADQVALLDAALWALRSPDLRSGQALANGGDPGFLLRSLELDTAATTPAVGIELVADGLFWPRGLAPLDGGPIAEARLRASGLPVDVVFAGRVVAGGPAVAFSLRDPGIGALRINGDGAAALDDGPYALAVFAENGGAAAGSLGGGAAGIAPWRRFTPADGVVAGTYTPPATAATEILVLAREQGGLELSRVRVEVS